MTEASIILPALNEPYLPTLIQHLHSELKNFDYEIIVVTSDRDKTPTPQLQNVHVYRSYGDSLERSILLGFSVAKGSKIVVMDADGSHPPSLVPELISHLNTYDMVVASRFLKNSKYYSPLFRKLTSYIFTSAAHVLGSSLSDPMSGFFAFNRKLLENVTFKPVKWKVAFELHLKTKPLTLEVPFTFEERKSGVSKSSIWVGLEILYDMLVVSL